MTKHDVMTVEESRAWRPEIVGWSDDILPFYARLAGVLPVGALIVELGTGQGRSAIFLAERMIELGNTSARLVCVDMDPAAKRWIKLHASPAVREIVRCVRSETASAAKLVKDGSVDLVFVDADHSLEGVRADLEAWAPKVAQSGILAGHDYSRLDFPGVVQAVDEFLGGGPLTISGTCWASRVLA